ncbi:MAG: response regulator [Burkholderiales bacterium]|nr:MAG: response regulator [Burkholderiales bacterium]
MTEKYKILIVDDESVVRQAFMRILSSERCTVEAVSNGPDALVRMQQQRFDVVLLDLKMPGIDGMTVLRTIKACWPETEVIVVTGYAAIETAKQSVTLGAFDYMAKPVGPDEVVNVTNDALLHKGWALHREPPASDPSSEWADSPLSVPPGAWAASPHDATVYNRSPS